MAPILGSVGVDGTHPHHHLSPRTWRSNEGLTGRQVMWIVIGSMAYGFVMVGLIFWGMKKGWRICGRKMGRKTTAEKKAEKKAKKKEEWLADRREVQRLQIERIQGDGLADEHNAAVQASILQPKNVMKSAQ